MSIYTHIFNKGNVENLIGILETENPLHEECWMISPSIGIAIALLHVHGGIELLTESLQCAVNRTCDIFGESYTVSTTTICGLTAEMVYALDMLCLRGYEQVIIGELLEDIKISAMSSSMRYNVKQCFTI